MSHRRVKNQKTEDSTMLPESPVIGCELQGEDVEGSVADKSATSRTRKTRKAAPSLRQRRGTSASTRKSKRNRIEEAPEEPAIYSKEGDCMTRENTSGLAILPPELLSEIISYLPQIQTPFQRNLLSPLRDDESGLERLAFLRALSQTCRSLRNFALPLCWETIEAVSCDSETINNVRDSKWGKALATDLVRQLEIVTVRDPSLAQYVKVVTVLMTPWYINGVIKELARCLALFPNLHTLQILGDLTPKYQPKFRAFFNKVKLLGVRTLAITVPAAFPVMDACPNLIKLAPFVVSNRDMHGHKLRVKEMGNFPHLEQLRHVQLQNPDILRDAIQKFPQLKVIDLVTWRSWSAHLDSIPDCLELMRKLENLHCIRFHSGWIGDITPQNLATAQTVLRNSPHPLPGSHKCVIHVVSGKSEHCLILGKEVPGGYCPYAIENGTPTQIFEM